MSNSSRSKQAFVSDEDSDDLFRDGTPETDPSRASSPSNDTAGAGSNGEDGEPDFDLSPDELDAVPPSPLSVKTPKQIQKDEAARAVAMQIWNQVPTDEYPNLPNGTIQLKFILNPLGAGVQRKFHCQGVTTTYEIAGIGIYEHFGKHEHKAPDQRRVRHSGLEQLRGTVLAHPHTKAVGLSSGKVKTGSGAVVDITPARALDTALINQDRLATKRLQLLKEAGILASGSRDGSLLDFLNIQGDGSAGSGVAIRAADFTAANFHVIVQTDWQRAFFVDRDSSAEQLINGHAGVLTDVTYSLFSEFFLCGSSVFSVQLGRWVPIAWTVLRNQRDEDFVHHFSFLFDTLTAADKSRTEVELLLRGVMDFPQAHSTGFERRTGIGGSS